MKINLMNFGMVALFFVSGIPALLYQIIWQQRLHTIYGAHAESVAIVVGAFMLGLGIGSLLGGRVADQRKISPFALFFLIECIIGIFGYFSLHFFDIVGAMTTQVNLWSAAVIIFLLVLVPTAAMGATLPILSAALIKRFSNVGVSVGMLYFVNTLGSGFAALLSVALLSDGLGQHGLVLIAACLNAAVAFFTLVLGVIASKQAVGTEGEREEVAHLPLPKLAAWLAFFSGFIALSAEIIWFRVVFLFVNGRAFAFPLSLGFFLLGIAAGSFVVMRITRTFTGKNASLQTRNIAGLSIILAGVILPLATVLAGLLAKSGNGILILPLTSVLAFPLGILFPLLMHLGVAADEHAGRSISNIYAANILGSTLGSVGTGFILFEYFSLRGIVAGLFFMSLVVAYLLVRKQLSGVRAGLIAVMLSVLVICGYAANTRLYERLSINLGVYVATSSYAHIVENRSGVIAVTENGIVFGTGVYDGRYNTDLAHDMNGILRPYALSAFHPNPERLLVIGLSSGSWAQVLANNPYVKEMTVVEINPGYQELIPNYPAVASLLTNPRVHIVIEDARRWLVRHPSEKFDAIIMNTTYYWRAGTTNLLSKDFLEILRTHLRDGGVVMYNTTSSRIVQKTAVSVYPYAWRLLNEIIVSDSPMPPNTKRLEQVLRGYTIDGKSVLDLDSEEGKAALMRSLSAVNTTQEYTSTSTLESREHILSRTAGIPVVTDDNMLIEWHDLENSR